MKIRMLVNTKTRDSRNVYLEIDGEYSDLKLNRALEDLTDRTVKHARLIDRDDKGRATWMVEMREIESVRFFYENDGDDITDW